MESNLNLLQQQLWQQLSDNNASPQENSGGQTRIKAGAASLGIDLPGNMMEKLVARYDGMAPMDRFLADPDA